MKKYRKILIPLLILSFVLPFSIKAIAEGQTYTYDTSEGSSWTKVDDTTWTKDTDGDGNPDVTATKGTDENGNVTWTYHFAVEDDAQTYQVYEKNLESNGKRYSGTDITASGYDEDWNELGSGYTPSGSDGKTAIDADPGTVDADTKTYTITNKKDHETHGTGDLTITKNVTGTMADEDQKFVFTVTLEGLTDEAVYSGVPFVESADSAGIEGVVTLGKDETKTITGIPAKNSNGDEVTYTVKEAGTVGYTLSSSSGDTGTITEDGKAGAVFVNASSYTKPETGSFSVTKEVKGNTPKDAEYTFHVLLTGLTPNVTYHRTSGMTEYEFTSSDEGEADITFTLKAGETCSFENLPVGASYQISEDGGEYTSDYTVKEGGSDS